MIVWVSVIGFLLSFECKNFFVLLDSVGDHFGEIAVLIIGHFIESTVAAYNLSDIFGTDAEHDHVVAVGGELGEDEVFFAEDGFLEGLAFVWTEAEHLFVGGLEDSGVPEVLFFPEGVLVDRVLGVEQFLGVVLHPEVCEQQPQQPPQHEDVVFFRALCIKPDCTFVSRAIMNFPSSLVRAGFSIMTWWWVRKLYRNAYDTIR
jgi:hypothetical protein